MRSRLAFSLLLGATVLMSACGAESNDSDASPVQEAVEVMAAAPAQADAGACDVDRRSLEIAVEAYYVLNGALPASQTDLVEGQLLLELSPRFDVTADGTVVPSAGSPCT